MKVRSEFFAPLPLLMVALMVFNDRVLKLNLHNELSGKLSDVAVCFFMPLYTSACLSTFVRPLAPRTLRMLEDHRVRLKIGCWFTALFYTALELVEPVERLALAALHWLGPWLGISRFGLTSDLTDLLTLPLVYVAYRYAIRRLEDTPTSARDFNGPGCDCTVYHGTSSPVTVPEEARLSDE